MLKMIKQFIWSSCVGPGWVFWLRRGWFAKKNALNALKALNVSLSCAGLQIFCRSGTLCSKISRGGFRQAERCLAYAGNWSQTMSPASKAGLIRGISKTCGFMRPVLLVHETVTAVSARRRPVASLRRLCPLASDGLGPVSGGVVFSKLSRLLNQEDALSAPCLQRFRNYCGAPSRGAEMLRTGVTRRF